MKGILSLLKKPGGGKPSEGPRDSVLFTTAFAGQGVHDSLLVPWEARAVEVGATRLPKSRGEAAIQWLAAFVEDAKASGFVAQALAQHQVPGAVVAPGVQP